MEGGRLIGGHLTEVRLYIHTVSFKEVALVYQTAADLLKDVICDSIPTGCNNQHLLWLNYLVRMIVVVQIAMSIK